MARYVVGIENLGCRLGVVSVVQEERTDLLHSVGASVVGEETEVPDAVEACGEDMEEKAPDELIVCQP